MKKLQSDLLSLINRGIAVSFVIVLLFTTGCGSNNQEARTISGTETYIQSILADREKLEKETADTTISRFNAEEIAQFKIKPRQYFYPDTTYIIKAVFTLDTSTPVFRMPTNTDRKPRFRIYGYLDFSIHDTVCRLTAYQYMETPEDDDFLFIPFGDKTNDYTTYGGGRYLDIPIPLSDTVILDFNKAYNPYCSYSDRWSCTLVPPVNMLDVHIFAGEKIYREGHH
jgi:uncharacterized protein (DUF1684 family)